MDRKKLTVFTMCLNEIAFIKSYLDSVLEYTDQLIIVDGGSTDGTIEVVQEYIRRINYPEIILIQYKQTGRPYSEAWDAGKPCNMALDIATGDWRMKLDVDEIMSDKFKDILPELMAMYDDDRIFGFEMICFWGDLKHRRMNSPEDPRWSCLNHKMWNNKDARFPHFHHSGLTPAPKNVIPIHQEIYMFHLHYGVKAKPIDNRRWEMDLTDEQTIDGTKAPNFQKIDQKYVVEYHGKYPAAVKKHFGV